MMWNPHKNSTSSQVPPPVTNEMPTGFYLPLTRLACSTTFVFSFVFSAIVSAFASALVRGNSIPSVSPSTDNVCRYPVSPYFWKVTSVYFWGSKELVGMKLMNSPFVRAIFRISTILSFASGSVNT
jgi:hypothetical protein